MNKRLPSRRKNEDMEERQGAKLGPDVKAKIGQHLRVMYGEIVDQGVPNRFVDILRRLDEPGSQDNLRHVDETANEEGSNNGPS